MTILMTDKTEISVMAHVGCASMDFLGAVTRAVGEDEWTTIFRVRKIVDERAFDSDDIKKWYNIRCPNEEKAREVLQQTVTIFALLVRSDVDWINLHCRGVEAFHRLAALNLPWWHAKVLNAGGDA